MRDLLKASLAHSDHAIERFERRLAETLGFPYGLFFPYGRSALHTLLKALGWKDEEVVLPAYICVVVPNAIVLSGNRVKFVDCELDHFNVSADRLASVLSESTKMVIPTSLYGYPVDRKGYEAVINGKSPEAFVLYDIAQAFGVEDEDGLQAGNAHGAFVGLGMGKMLSSIEGGMLLLRDEIMYRLVRTCRDDTFTRSGLFKTVEKFLLGLATYWALREPFLTFTDLIENNSRLLDRFTGEIPVERGPFLPDNAREMPTELQAKLGLRQLCDYDRILRHRREIASRYEALLKSAGFPLFSWSTVPTYAQFPIMVRDREGAILALRKRGVQARSTIPYACSDLPGYETFRGKFPNASDIAKRIIVLPNWYGITHSSVERVVETLARCREKDPDIFCQQSGDDRR